jgi:hypothetical protein
MLYGMVCCRYERSVVSHGCTLAGLLTSTAFPSAAATQQHPACAFDGHLKLGRRQRRPGCGECSAAHFFVPCARPFGPETELSNVTQVAKHQHLMDRQHFGGEYWRSRGVTSSPKPFFRR